MLQRVYATSWKTVCIKQSFYTSLQTSSLECIHWYRLWIQKQTIQTKRYQINPTTCYLQNFYSHTNFICQYLQNYIYLIITFFLTVGTSQMYKNLLETNSSSVMKQLDIIGKHLPNNYTGPIVQTLKSGGNPKSSKHRYISNMNILAMITSGHHNV